MRRQLRVEQIAHMQVQHLQAAQALQGGLQWRQLGRKFGAFAGNPDKALGRQTAVLQAVQRIAFLHRVALDGKNSHRQAPWPQRAAGPGVIRP